jgi:hypothetical protein
MVERSLIGGVCEATELQVFYSPIHFFSIVDTINEFQERDPTSYAMFVLLTKNDGAVGQTNGRFRLHPDRDKS